VVIPCRYNFRARLSSCEVSLSLCVVLHAFLFHSLFSFSLHAMLPLLTNKDEYSIFYLVKLKCQRDTIIFRLALHILCDLITVGDARSCDMGHKV